MEIKLFISGKYYILSNFSEIPRIGETLTVDDKKYTIVNVEWVTNTHGLEDVKRLKKIVVYVKE